MLHRPLGFLQGVGDQEIHRLPAVVASNQIDPRVSAVRTLALLTQLGLFSFKDQNLKGILLFTVIVLRGIC